MKGFFGNVMKAGKNALWELIGAKLINVPANLVISSAGASVDTGYLITAAMATVPAFLEKWLGEKAELFTTGAFFLLGNKVFDNTIASMGLPANVTSLLQDNGATTVYIPQPNQVGRWLPPGQTGPVSRMVPTGGAVGFKPMTH